MKKDLTESLKQECTDQIISEVNEQMKAAKKGSEEQKGGDVPTEEPSE